MEDNLDKIKKAETKYLSEILKLYQNKREWSQKDFKHLYNIFIKFVKEIESSELKILNSGYYYLRLAGVFNNLNFDNLHDVRNYIYSILDLPLDSDKESVMEIPVRITIISVLIAIVSNDKINYNEIKKESDN